MMKTAFFNTLLELQYPSAPVLSLQIAYLVDINTAHWAYGAIETLVNDGTVEGFEDGSFRTGQNGFKSEFVKMIGMGSKKVE